MRSYFNLVTKNAVFMRSVVFRKRLEEYRKRGVARDMLEACQKWAKEQGCAEFASDCELDNEDSLKFHIKMGFVEANRIICFTKKLKDSVIGRQVTVTVDRPLGSYHLNYKDMD